MGAAAETKDKYALAGPVEGGIQYWEINDMERMYAVASVHVSFPNAEQAIHALWDQIPARSDAQIVQPKEGK
jgi:hypothetical protein